jgi:hypothetical protein
MFCFARTKLSKNKCRNFNAFTLVPNIKMNHHWYHHTSVYNSNLVFVMILHQKVINGKELRHSTFIFCMYVYVFIAEKSRAVAMVTTFAFTKLQKIPIFFHQTQKSSTINTLCMILHQKVINGKELRT